MNEDEKEQETPQTPEDENLDKNEDGETPKDSKEYQKKHWREKYQNLKGIHDSEVSALKTQLEELKSLVKKPDNDAEAKAQEYIRAQARAVYEELLKKQQEQEDKAVQDISDKIDEILDEHPDVSKEELLEIMEEEEVEPEIALKIYRRQSKTKEKPKMPKPKQAGGESPKEMPDDSKKSMWDILREESANHKGK